MSNSYYECACCSYITDDFDAIQRHMAEQHTGRAADLASVVTRQRSEIDTLRAELARVTAERDAARELLRDAFWQLGPNFLDDGQTLHPGNVSTIHALYDYLGGWGGVKRE